MLGDPRPQNFPIFNKLKELVRTDDRWSFWYEVLAPAMQGASDQIDELATKSANGSFQIDDLYLVLEEVLDE